MSLEELIAENTAELKKLNANFATLKGSGSTAPKGAGSAGPTFDEVKTAAKAVQDKHGKPAARAIIKKHGAEALADLDKKKYAAFIAACEVAVNEDAAGGDEGNDDL